MFVIDNCSCLCVMFIGFTWVITWNYVQPDRIIIMIWLQLQVLQLLVSLISYNRTNYLLHDIHNYSHQSPQQDRKRKERVTEGRIFMFYVIS